MNVTFGSAFPVSVTACLFFWIYLTETEEKCDGFSLARGKRREVRRFTIGCSQRWQTCVDKTKQQLFFIDNTVLPYFYLTLWVIQPS